MNEIKNTMVTFENVKHHDENVIDFGMLENYKTF